MTIGEALERAEQLRPNCRIETETRLQWLREADALLRTKLFDRAAAGAFAALGETDRYAGEQAQYNARYAELAVWLLEAPQDASDSSMAPASTAVLMRCRIPFFFMVFLLRDLRVGWGGRFVVDCTSNFILQD